MVLVLALARLMLLLQIMQLDLEVVTLVATSAHVKKNALKNG